MFCWGSPALLGAVAVNRIDYRIWKTIICKWKSTRASAANMHAWNVRAWRLCPREEQLVCQACPYSVDKRASRSTEPVGSVPSKPGNDILNWYEGLASPALRSLFTDVLQSEPFPVAPEAQRPKTKYSLRYLPLLYTGNNSSLSPLVHHKLYCTIVRMRLALGFARKERIRRVCRYEI